MKYKRSLSKVEAEAFESKFYWLLDKAKGRKTRKMASGTANDAIQDGIANEGSDNGAPADDVSDNASETESESSDDEFLNEILGKLKAYMPKRDATSPLCMGTGLRSLRKSTKAEDDLNSMMDVEGKLVDSKPTTSSDAMEVVMSADVQNPSVTVETDDENDAVPGAGGGREEGKDKKKKKKGGAKAKVVDPIVDEYGNLIEHRISGYFTTKKGDKSSEDHLCQPGRNDFEAKEYPRIHRAPLFY